MSDPIKANGVKHLHGNTYKVKAELVRFADEEIAEQIKFINPRRVIAGGKMVGAGFSKEEMSELREDIRSSGLLHDLIMMYDQNIDKFILLGGERRKRCIDSLIKDNVSVYNPETDKVEPANKVYEYINCKVFSNIDLKTAYKYAFSENESAVNIGDAATVHLIKKWRESGMADSDILEITGKSITWLRDTDQLIKLDNKTLEALASKQINRTVALELSSIEDVDSRLVKLAKAKEMAIQRIQMLKEKITTTLKEAEEKAELAAAQLTDAEMTGNKTLRKKAQAKKEKLEDKIEDSKKDLESLDDKHVVVGVKDLIKADDELGEGIIRQLTMSKIKKHWYEDAKAIIDGKLEGNYNIDVNDAKLVRALIDGIDKGEKDIAKILHHHNKVKK